MPAEFLTAVNAMLESGLAEEPRKQRRSRRDEAPAGPLWSKDVPGSKEIVAHVIEFARRGGLLEFKLNDNLLATGEIESIRAEATGLIVSYAKSFLTSVKTHETTFIPYPDGPDSKIARLCKGEAVAYGRATVQLKDPDLSFWSAFEGGAAKLSWDKLQVSFRGLIFTHRARVKEIVVGPDTGEIVLDDWKNFFMPTLIWRPLAKEAA